MGEVEHTLQDLAICKWGAVVETLLRLTEKDVAFDTDEVVVDEDEKDIGWINEVKQW